MPAKARTWTITVSRTICVDHGRPISAYDARRMALKDHSDVVSDNTAVRAYPVPE